MKIFGLLLLLLPLALPSQELVILHTNDTHSTILPDRDGLGGVTRRKALVDSVRQARGAANVVLVDAGDAVQGSLFFTIFGGEVEGRVMNDMGYDVQILGNHEFDNGVEALKHEYSRLNATRISTNYDFADTALAALFVPYAVRQAGDKRVGFLGLNLNPKGLIADDNVEGVSYRDAIKAANAAARELKRKHGADMVVAVSHLGYDTDTDADDRRLAAASTDIDIIIGGHTHTLLPGGARVASADGDSVLIVQTGSRGKMLGEIDIDLATGRVDNRLLPVDSRLDTRLDPDLVGLVAAYGQRVDSLMKAPLAFIPTAFGQKAPETLNLLSDFVQRQGVKLTHAPVDLAIMNKGGIRTSLPAGVVTEGEVVEMAPFNNRIVVLEIDGADLLDNFAVMARQQGNGVSRGVEVAYAPDGRVSSATINGQPVERGRKYRLATIDYLAQGNDYMEPLKRGREVANSREALHRTLRRALADGTITDLYLRPDSDDRMKPAAN